MVYIYIILLWHGLANKCYFMRNSVSHRMCATHGSNGNLALPRGMFNQFSCVGIKKDDGVFSFYFFCCRIFFLLFFCCFSYHFAGIENINGL